VTIEKYLLFHAENNSIFTIFEMSSNNKCNGMKKYKVKEVIGLLLEDEWFIARQRGSHKQFKHPVKKGIETVNGKPNDVLDQFILNSIWKQAGWK
jgi:predicted RNA binding protein YcfA (HicA-like mRNA interferase family)